MSGTLRMLILSVFGTTWVHESTSTANFISKYRSHISNEISVQMNGL